MLQIASSRTNLYVTQGAHVGQIVKGNVGVAEVGLHIILNLKKVLIIMRYRAVQSRIYLNRAEKKRLRHGRTPR